MNLLHEEDLGDDLGDGDVGGDDGGDHDDDYKDNMIFLELNLHTIRWAREAYNLGIRYIGGCCGFEPYHIRWIFWDNGMAKAMVMAMAMAMAMAIAIAIAIVMAMATRAIAEELSKERGRLPEGSDKSDYDLAHMKRICESYSGKQVN